MNIKNQFNRRYISIIAAVCLIASLVIISRFIFKPQAKPTNTVISRSGTITLKDTPHDRRFTTGDEIAGNFQTSKDQGLFYMLTDSKKQIMGSGSILSDKNGSFSRNLEVNRSIANNTPLTLHIYSQDKKGKTKDDLIFTFAYRGVK